MLSFCFVFFFLTNQKIMLSSGRGQGIVGFEAKAKNLRFEAKDFKMCPRGLKMGQINTFGHLEDQDHFTCSTQ